MNTRFALDKSNARLMGVCAGFARWADVDPFLVRIGAVATAIYFFPIVLMYLLAGKLAPQSLGEGA